jgi:3-oxoadipate enol-lactonase
MPYLERPDGCQLYHELHGPEAGTSLLLLEGMGGDIPGWRRNIPHFASTHLVIAYDFRGNGRSDKPDESQSMATFVNDTVALLDHLGLAPAHVYGQSFGGMVAMQMALSHPRHVRSLVLGCTHAGPARSVKPGADARVPKDKPYLALYAPAFAEEHPEHVEEDILVGSQNPRPLHAGRRQWQVFQSWDVWDRLGEISRPTLVIHGTEDRLVPVENGRRLAAAIPGAELVLLEGAGHVYHSEQPDVADRAVLDFQARTEGR